MQMTSTKQGTIANCPNLNGSRAQVAADVTFLGLSTTLPRDP